MNPPSALYGAMSKERKPFTYTPGGLDLSEIKSERMAKRLMRNAMSEGVPEKPIKSIQSPQSVTHGVLSNFNCLPVQVFPTFQLPANPKSLLRSRSNPDGPKESPIIDKRDVRKKINKPLPQPPNYSTGNNSTQVSTNNLKTNQSYIPLKTDTRNYGSYDNNDVILPEKSYDAEYCKIEPLVPSKILERKNIVYENKTLGNVKCNQNVFRPDMQLNTICDNGVIPVALTSEPTQDIATSNYDQKQVKIVSKQTKSEKETEENGDTDTAVVVKLPTKSSAAKTETKVEVLKKILPDGTVEEVKITTTKTTKDGKTEISTETETRTIPKEIAGHVEIEEHEEESENLVEENESEDIVEEVQIKETELENEQEVAVESDEEVVIENIENIIKENGNLITGEEKIETSTTKKVVVIQSTEPESEEEVEEEVEEEEEEEETGDVNVEEVVVLKQPEPKKHDEDINETVENEKEEVDEEVTQNEDEEQEAKLVADDKPASTSEVLQAEDENQEEQEEVVEEEEEQEEIEEEENTTPIASKEEEQTEQNKDDENCKETEDKPAEEDTQKEQEEREEEEEYAEAEDTEVKVQDKLTDGQSDKTTGVNINITLEREDAEVSIGESTKESKLVSENTEETQVKDEIIHKTAIPEPRVTFREPSIPFEKVEEIEIKPIGPAQEIIKKSHTEIITTTTDKPSGALSTQTEYNRIENIVTVNRTSKTLDQAYEQTQHQIPTLKTYFSPSSDRVLSTPQPASRPYQPIYPSETQTERRHSLLLDRLSVDRQIPSSDIYQNNYNVNQSYEQNQWSEEPQSEVLTVSNVKPSTINKNQQWYQQTKRENILSSTASPTPVLPSQTWNHKSPTQTQNQLSTQSPYQTYTQQQYTPKPEYQATYIENNAQNIYKGNTNNHDQNVYPSYTPKPSWVSSTYDSKPAPPLSSNMYSSLGNESTESFQKSTQQFSSSYVPPPWEQDSSYVNNSQNYYQAPPPSTIYTPSTNQQPSWKPTPAPNKFSKPTSTSYIPPAPNQSFVKPVSAIDASKISGRKTYYSEYERRYISVPESTYIPNETKYPAQPDPSPQYYYDNNEPTETVEPQWRKELREFTEKTSQSTTQTEKSSVRPPWEEEPKYASEYTTPVTPSWTQTLRPRSWRERSYEPEYIGSKEWPKSNTLGRGRPQSSYIKSNVDTIPERTRGVSVDRYNPNSYHSPIPSEHPPVQSHTLDPTIHPKTYHNPHVPAYHARASAEPREQTTAYPQQRIRADARTPPVQSRSFKYLQWITGTED